MWALRSKAAPEACIGAIDLWRDGQPEHRGLAGAQVWGQGLMTEACEAVNAHAFEALGFEELIFSQTPPETRVAARQREDRRGVLRRWSGALRRPQADRARALAAAALCLAAAPGAAMIGVVRVCP